jgi:crossover junction endodeoxyribonuclease RuvC
VIRILGIDPGSRVTGYGVVDADGPHSVYVASGSIRIAAGGFPDRLRTIFEGLRTVVQTHRPDEVAVEQVFVSRNADSALKLGQARGAAICAAVVETRPVSEYSARQIKLAVVGTGAAAKVQVQHMISALLRLPGTLSPDASDALAVALCHSHHRQRRVPLPGAAPVPGQGAR